MTSEFLCTQYPHLWHMAAANSWPSIKKHGLLSTSALLRRYGVRGARRLAIETKRRPECVTLQKLGLPDAVIRDNKPATDSALAKCLQDGLLPSDWYRILNERTFFWLSRIRLRRLLGARAYRNNPQTVLTISASSLLETHESCIELSPINSGSTIYRPVPRGKSTFLSIQDYDYDYWRKKRGRDDAVVELIVRHSVPDIRKHVIAVHDWVGGRFVEVWRRTGPSKSIGP
jgi:hypothetical protein